MRKVEHPQLALDCTQVVEQRRIAAERPRAADQEVDVDAIRQLANLGDVAREEHVMARLPQRALHQLERRRALLENDDRRSLTFHLSKRDRPGTARLDPLRSFEAT